MMTSVLLPSSARASCRCSKVRSSFAADHAPAREIALGCLIVLLRVEASDSGELVDYGRRVRRPLQRVHAEHGHDQGVERRRDAFGTICDGRSGGRLPDAGQILHRARRKRVPPGQRPIPGRAEREQVRTLVERQSTQRLGRHARRRADDFLRDAEGGERTEVDQLGTTIGGQPHVAGADVAMHHAMGMDQRER